MRILLSAYACEPERGSEPGLGWTWALETARLGHQVTVITRESVHRAEVEAWMATHCGPPGLEFVYCEVPGWRRGGTLSMASRMLHYYLWQWSAYVVAQAVHAQEPFDIVHHVTWAGVRFPSFMGGLGIPMVFGPAGGGERAPFALRRGWGLRGLAREGLRDVAMLWAHVDPFLRRTFTRADWIFVHSRQDFELIPPQCRAKTRVRLGIGSVWASRAPPTRRSRPRSPRLLCVGRLLHWKGMDLGIAAFARVASRFPDARLTLAEAGPAEGDWRKLADRLGVADRLVWAGWRRQEQLSEAYASNDLFLFPSLHDSGGMVVVDAMAHGLPVIRLRLGGPGTLVDESSGYAVDTAHAGYDQVVDSVAGAAIELIESPEKRERLSVGARHRASEFTWSAQVEAVYHEVFGGRSAKGRQSSAIGT